MENKNLFETDDYHTLTQNQSKVLYGIWLAGHEKGEENATRENVAQASGVKIENLGRILFYFKNSLRDKYYEAVRVTEYDNNKQKRGPRLVFYRLKLGTFVTVPMTAKLFVELKQFKKEKDGRVDYKKYISEMKRKLKLNTSEIKERLEWGQSQGYVLISTDDKFIAPNKRIHCESGYLEELAKHF